MLKPVQDTARGSAGFFESRTSPLCDYCDAADLPGVDVATA